MEQAVMFVLIALILLELMAVLFPHYTQQVTERDKPVPREPQLAKALLFAIILCAVILIH